LTWALETQPIGAGVGAAPFDEGNNAASIGVAL
jgi:hypothetical protein